MEKIKEFFKSKWHKIWSSTALVLIALILIGTHFYRELSLLFTIPLSFIIIGFIMAFHHKEHFQVDFDKKWEDFTKDMDKKILEIKNNNNEFIREIKTNSEKELNELKGIQQSITNYFSKFKVEAGRLINETNKTTKYSKELLYLQLSKELEKKENELAKAKQVLKELSGWQFLRTPQEKQAQLSNQNSVIATMQFTVQDIKIKIEDLQGETRTMDIQHYDL